MTTQHPFTWRHVEVEIMLLCVRWSLRSSLISRDLEEIMRERGLPVDHPTVSRGVQCDAPEREKRGRPHLQTTTNSWRVDETEGNIKGTWMDRSRAVDSHEKTLEFRLSATRDAEAARCFFAKVPGASPTVTPRVIPTAKNAASPNAFPAWKAAGTLAVACELRQSTSRNHLIEHDHRFLKRLVKPGMGFFSFETAWRTLQGEEAMQMIRKGQMQGVKKGDSLRQAAFIADVFGVVIETHQNGGVLFLLFFLVFLQHSRSASGGIVWSALRGSLGHRTVMANVVNLSWGGLGLFLYYSSALAGYLLPGVAGGWATWPARRLVLDLQAGLLTGMMGALAIFLVSLFLSPWLFNAGQHDPQTLQEFAHSGLPDLRTFVVSDYLAGMIAHLWIGLTSGLFLGLLGGTVGKTFTHALPWRER